MRSDWHRPNSVFHGFRLSKGIKSPGEAHQSQSGQPWARPVHGSMVQKNCSRWVHGRPIKVCIKVIWSNWKLFSGPKSTIIDMLRSRASRHSQAPMDLWQASLISHIWEILRYPWIQEVAYPGKPPIVLQLTWYYTHIHYSDQLDAT